GPGAATTPGKECRGWGARSTGRWPRRPARRACRREGAARRSSFRRRATGSRASARARSSRSSCPARTPRGRRSRARAPRRAPRPRPRARSAARRRGRRRSGRGCARGATPAARRAAARSGLGLLSRGQPPHDLLHHVALHVAVEELLLRFLRQHVGVVVGYVARELERALRHVVVALAVVHAEADAVAQPKFAHPPGAGERKDLLGARLAGELEDRLGLFRVAYQLHVAAGAEVARQVERDPCGRVRYVHAAERQVGGAAQVEPAPGERPREKDDEEFSQTTRLTSRPGTTITFFTFSPATNFCTFGLESASFSIAPRSAAFGTRIEPRSLPFTCTTSSISSCSSAAGSGSGQGARRMSSPNPSSRHRWCVRCGAMGESSLSRIESPSSVVAFQSSISSRALRIFMQAEATVLNCWRWMS